MLLKIYALLLAALVVKNDSISLTYALLSQNFVARICAFFRRFFCSEKQNPQTFLLFGCMSLHLQSLQTVQSMQVNLAHLPVNFLVFLEDWDECLPKGRSGTVQLELPLSANISTLDKPAAPVRIYPFSVPCQPPMVTIPETL